MHGIGLNVVINL